MTNRGYDSAVRVELANKIIGIAENYDSWNNLEEYKSEFADEVMDALSEFGLNMQEHLSRPEEIEGENNG